LQSIVGAIFGQAFAGPLLGDDLSTCRERQSDFKVQLEACERIMAGGRTAPKDLAGRFAVRAEWLSQKRDYDNAIVTLNSAVEADPDNVRIIDARAVVHQRKGENDLAMADYNLALQSALDDFNLAVQYAPTRYVARTNRARILTMNKDFNGALADFAEAQKIDPDAVITAVYTAMGQAGRGLVDCNSAIARKPRTSRS
jgi:tetratricopeptide (TPR) repeat protein